MKKNIIVVGSILLVLLLVLVFWWKPHTAQAPIPVSIDEISYVNASEDDIAVSSPYPSQTVSQNITVTGKARGPWYFEASFPLEVRDMEGNILGQGYTQAIGDWMTTEFVPFSGQVSLKGNLPQSGVLIIRNANPSGDSERDKSVEIPVQFEK